MKKDETIVFGGNMQEWRRYEYPLTRESKVLDVGGYKGTFAAQIADKYGCKVFVLEPVFTAECFARLGSNANIKIAEVGLGRTKEKRKIFVREDATSVFPLEGPCTFKNIELITLKECLEMLDLNDVDLCKLNIEGQEYDVLESSYELMTKIRFLQVQFHRNVSNHQQRYEMIQRELMRTHRLAWHWTDVDNRWQSWERKEG